MPDPLINRRLGKYLIQQEIGRGGMARVYRATDTVLQRQVALKILAPQIGSDPDLATRFDREAITAANLRHPSIITIFDVGEIDGLRYIAMEYIDGRTLAAVLTERGALSLPLSIAVLRPVAEALNYAHGQGAVHRDVKPQNIMIDSDGRVLLTDFGIALGPSRQGQKLTQAGLFMGTPEYISPEQAQGQGLNGLSDLYSLGIVAYEMLAGRVPFSGDVPQLLMAHVYTPVPRITLVNPSLPLELDQVFARVLAKPPEQRLGRTTSLVDALRLVAQRHGLQPATQAELATLAAPPPSSAGQATVLLPTAGQAMPPASEMMEPARQDTPPIAEADQFAAVFGPPPLAPSSVPQPPLVPTPPAVRPALVYPQVEQDEVRPRPRPRPAADQPAIPWAGIIVVLVALLLLVVVLLHPGASTGAGSAPPGTPRRGLFEPPTVVPTVAGIAALPPAADNVSPTTVPPATPTIVAAGATTGSSAAPATASPPSAPASAQPPSPVPAPPVVTPSPLPATAPPSGTATGVTATATDLPSPTQLPPTVTPPPPSATRTAPPAVTTAPPGAPTPIGNATRLMTEAGNALLLFDVPTGKTVTLVTNAHSLGPPAISPDGQTILFDGVEGGKQRIFRFDIREGTARPLLDPPVDADLYHASWSPNGSRIVFVSTAGGSPNLYALSASGSGAPQRLTNDSAIDDYPSWSPDGTEIMFESNRDGGKFALFLLDAAGVHRFSPPGQPFDDRVPRFSPDGSVVVFTSTRDRADGSSEIYVQPFVGGAPRRLTTFKQGRASGPAWSPDGKLIAFFANASGQDHDYVVPAAGGVATDLSPNTTTDVRWPVWGK